MIEEYGVEKANQIKEKMRLGSIKSSTKEKREKISNTLKEKYQRGIIKSPFSNPEIMKKIIAYSKTEERNKKLSISLKGKIYTEETRRKLRMIRARQIEDLKKDGINSQVQVGRYEKQILDYLENCLGYKIERQYLVSGFFLDGYCPALNLAIEIDEPHHCKYIEKDLIRQKEIEEAKQCRFLRINSPEVI